jgi:hypothetical protein
MNTQKFSFTTVALTVWAAASPMGFAADAGFAGSWKLNLQKSQLTGQTFNFEKTPSGMMHYDSQGWGCDFNPDGKEYAEPDGSVVVVHPVDADTWDWTFSMHGKVTMTLRSTVKGDTATFVMHVNKPDGSVVEQTSTAARVSGGPGLLGKWKSTEVKGAPTSLIIETSGKRGMTIKYPEFQQVCKGSFDGKDHTVSQAGAASKLTFTFERTGANAFKVTTKLQGKRFYTDVFTLSPDGHALTDEGNPVSVNEPVKSVYERQ